MDVSQSARRFPVRVRSAFYADHARRLPGALGQQQFFQSSHHSSPWGELRIMTTCERGAFVRVHFYTLEDLQP